MGHLPFQPLLDSIRRRPPQQVCFDRPPIRTKIRRGTLTYSNPTTASRPSTTNSNRPDRYTSPRHAADLVLTNDPTIYMGPSPSKLFPAQVSAGLISRLVCAAKIDAEDVFSQREAAPTLRESDGRRSQTMASSIKYLKPSCKPGFVVPVITV